MYLKQERNNLDVPKRAGEADSQVKKSAQRKTFDDKRHSEVSQQQAVMQRQQTDVCLKSASGTYKLKGDNTLHSFSFREGSKGSDVLQTTRSHPSSHVDYTTKIIKYLKKYNEIPKAAINVILTSEKTYGIKK